MARIISIDKLTGVGLPPSLLFLERLCGRDKQGERSLQQLERGEGLLSARGGLLGHIEGERIESEKTEKKWTAKKFNVSKTQCRFP